MTEVTIRVTTTPPATIEVQADPSASVQEAIAAAEAAEASATTAEAAQVAAAASASAALVSASDAAISATAADGSAIAAAASAAAADASADEAATSAAEAAALVGLTPQDFGAVGDGVADDTAALIDFLEAGGNLYVPEGIYRIAGTGPDSGGAYATITKSLSVACHPNVRFVADDLDNDMIRLSVPADGTGLPADGITVEWKGGYFDQSAQKVSTVVPFLAQYPAPVGLAGTSATCDGLSIRGSYVAATVEYNGIKRCEVSNVTTYGGTHWEVAGGDSGIYVDGCEEQSIQNCTNIGNRDLGVYASAGVDGLLRCRTVIANNLHVNCFHGSSIKRSAGYSRIVGNHAENCVRGFLIDKIVGPGHAGAVVSDNSGNQCGTFVRANDCIGFTITENHFTSIGALLNDGTTVEPVAGSVGILVGETECDRGIVADNTLDGRTAGLETAYASHNGFIYGDVNSARVGFRNNIGNDLRILGQDLGASNLFIDNVLYNSTSSPYLGTLGTGSVEQRRNPTTNAPWFRQPVTVGDGSVSAPAISRAAQTNTGMYFAADEVLLAANGALSARFGNGAYGFRGKYAAGSVWAAPTGTPSRATFATSTVTTEQLAQRVMALLNDLIGHGVIRDV